MPHQDVAPPTQTGPVDVRQRAVDSGDPIFAPLSASGGILDRLFGIYRAVGRSSSGLTFDPSRQTPGALDVERFIFDIGQSIQHALPINALEQAGIDTAQLAAGQLPSSLDLLNLAQQTAEEGLRTGLRQDLVGNLTPTARDFLRKSRADIREELTGSNILASASLGEQFANIDQEVINALLARQAEEDVAAANRRSAFTQLSPFLAESQVAVPLNLGAELGQIGESFRLAQQSIADRPFNAFQAIAGLQPAALTQRGFNPQDDSDLGAFADVAGALATTAGGFFKGGGFS